jgi:DNA helicase-2/ATP-dependent DNA helicase PcrA
VENGWDFSTRKTKILMLTHNVLADEQGYRNLADVFTHTDSYIKKEDAYIAFFADVVEPVCNAYKEHKYGEMFSMLDSKTLAIRKHEDKIQWATDMDKLMELRESGTIGQVIEHLSTTKRPRLPERIEASENKYNKLLEKEEKIEKDIRFIDRIRNMRHVSYAEVIALVKFIEDTVVIRIPRDKIGLEYVELNKENTDSEKSFFAAQFKPEEITEIMMNAQNKVQQDIS